MSKTWIGEAGGLVFVRGDLGTGRSYNISNLSVLWV